MKKMNRYHGFRFPTPEDPFGEVQFIPGFVIVRSNLVVDPDTRDDALLLYRERVIQLEEIHAATHDVSEMTDWHQLSKRDIGELRWRINLLQED